MVTHLPPDPLPEQLAMEQAFFERVEHPGAAPAGRPTVDEFTLRVGAHKLLLFPGSGRWMWWDPLHEDWSDTGYSAGEATFHDLDGKLVARRTNRYAPDRPAADADTAAPSADPLRPAWLGDAEIPPTAEPAGSSPASASPDGVSRSSASPARFCIHCGVALPDEAHFCPGCGKPVRRG